jgi:hypothetical protein
MEGRPERRRLYILEHPGGVRHATANLAAEFAADAWHTTSAGAQAPSHSTYAVTPQARGALSLKDISVRLWAGVLFRPATGSKSDLDPR